MSKPKYKWWSYVKWMIRLQPEREAELKRRQETSITANYNSMPHGSEPQRTTENLGVITLGNPADREMEAVRKAIEDTERLKTGKARIKIITLVYWKKSHTLQGACNAVHVAYDTGKVYHAEFIRLVAKYFGLLD